MAAMSTILHAYILTAKNMPIPCKINEFTRNYRGNFGLERNAAEKASS
jgi:hypothetical protein